MNVRRTMQSRAPGGAAAIAKRLALVAVALFALDADGSQVEATFEAVVFDTGGPPASFASPGEAVSASLTHPIDWLDVRSQSDLSLFLDMPTDLTVDYSGGSWIECSQLDVMVSDDDGGPVGEFVRYDGENCIASDGSEPDLTIRLTQFGGGVLDNGDMILDAENLFSSGTIIADTFDWTVQANVTFHRIQVVPEPHSGFYGIAVVVLLLFCRRKIGDNRTQTPV